MEIIWGLGFQCLEEVKIHQLKHNLLLIIMA
jgi:hypothetical protein